MSQTRLKPWFYLTEEERSYIIYQAYQKRALDSKEVSSYLRNGRIKTATNIAFPLVAYQGLKMVMPNKWNYTKSSLGRTGNILMAVGVLSILWLNWSPFYLNFLKKREDLLE